MATPNTYGLSLDQAQKIASYTSKAATGAGALSSFTPGVGTYLQGIKLADSLIAGINGSLDTTNVGGGAGFINNVLSSTLPGISGLFSQKIKDFKLTPNASYSSLTNSYNKLNANNNKKLMPWVVSKLNKEGEGLQAKSNKIKGLTTDFQTRSASMGTDTLLTNYLSSVNPQNFNSVPLGKEGFKIFSDELVNSIRNIKQVPMFKDGGKMNVIPEGALHARNHNIDSEELDGSITSKGIPVITKEEGGEIIQHAEIERDEIIFTLEVTKELERLAKKGTDEAAIEAGKLLAKEILHNTDDRTGLIKNTNIE